MTFGPENTREAWIVAAGASEMGVMEEGHDDDPFFDTDNKKTVEDFLANGCDLYEDKTDEEVDANSLSKCNAYYICASAECWYDDSSDEVEVQWSQPRVGSLVPVLTITPLVVIFVTCVVMP